MDEFECLAISLTAVVFSIGGGEGEASSSISLASMEISLYLFLFFSAFWVPFVLHANEMIHEPMLSLLPVIRSLAIFFEVPDHAVCVQLVRNQVLLSHYSTYLLLS